MLVSAGEHDLQGEAPLGSANIAFAPWVASIGAMSPIVPHSGVDYAPAPIRFSTRDPGVVPAAVLGAKNLFRPDVRCERSRCVLPGWLPAAFTDVDRAVMRAQRLMEKLFVEASSLFGDEGTPRAMTAMLRWMGSCFDWVRLVKTEPTQEDCAAVAALSEAMRPVLERTLWPTSRRLIGVARAWPLDQEMQMQYRGLCARLRNANLHATRSYATWTSLRGFMVRPIFTGGNVFVDIKQRIASRRWSPGVALDRRVTRVCSRPLEFALTARVAAKIRDFCGVAPIRAPICASLGNLRRCGVMTATGNSGKRRLRPLLLRSGAEHLKYSFGVPGSAVAVLILPGAKVGKLVHVEAPVQDFDVSAVSASLDGDPYFSVGAGTAGAAMTETLSWHCCRLHHQCRVVCTPEACCERVGSTLEDSFEARRFKGSLATLLDRVILREAGIKAAGGQRGERIARNVVATLQASKSVMGSALFSRTVRKRPGYVMHPAVCKFRTRLDRADTKAGRARVPVGTKRLERGVPIRLAKRVKVLRAQHGKRFKPRLRVRASGSRGAEDQLRVPRDIGDKRIEARLTAADIDARWLASEEGRAWTMKRKSLSAELCCMDLPSIRLSIKRSKNQPPWVVDVTAGTRGEQRPYGDLRAALNVF